jgi:pyridinium-3,5-bisthiocarboxylic acid mononucleotide nickel chelatase
VKIAYFDCFSGISGDMVLGALIDLGVPVDVIQAGIDSMGLSHVKIRGEVVKKSGFRAVKVHIEHPPEHAHRHLHHIEAMIDQGEALTPAARTLARKIFLLIGQAEAKMHNTTIQKVHFHEVGAIDSIADIVGAAIGFDYLGIERFEASPVPTGCGSVKIAHGLVSIPAPATAELLCGVPIAACNIEKELTTPTGAAILKATVSRFGALPSMQLDAVGYGAGTIDLPGQANVLRIAVGQIDDEASGYAVDFPSEFDRVVVIETNIDDSPAEDIAACVAKLYANGALDVYQTPCVMKKGRSGVQLTVIASPSSSSLLQQIVLTDTSTIGVRRYGADRRKLIRHAISLQTPYGELRAKAVDIGGGKQRMMVEYDDAQDAASKWNISMTEVRQAAAVAWALRSTQAE